MEIDTKRLVLNRLTTQDAGFIFSLVNTPGWIQFIGDRNILTEQDAIRYINKINGNPDIIYWVASLKPHKTKTGIITFIKRDYLDYHDIGFAFLPEFGGKGYAFEATTAILQHLQQNTPHETILATTIPSNEKSIKLLKRLGFHFLKEIENDSDYLSVYSLNPISISGPQKTEV